MRIAGDAFGGPQLLFFFFKETDVICTTYSSARSLEKVTRKSQVNHFFLLNMLWSRHVKPSPAIGEKSERSEIKDVNMYRLNLSGISMMYNL